MKRFLPLNSIIILLLLLVTGIANSQNSNQELKITDYVIPYPRQLEKSGDELLYFVADLNVKYTGKTSERLSEYAARTNQRIKTAFDIYKTETEKQGGKNLQLEINCQSADTISVSTDESYSLEVTEEKVILNSNTDIGAMHGLETILQLIQTEKGMTCLPVLKIEDSPRFQWRGLMIDVCRHFIPKNVILRNLDAMAMAKMNVFHWHLSEDQGFRIECKTFPKLHEMGSDGKYFTHEDVKEIIKYANDRGIRVVPEFDIPGHSSAWFVGYPEYASLPGKYEIERHYGVFDPTFDPTKEETYEFFDKFFREMSGLFNDEYMHIGGDENNGKQWDSSKAIQEFKKANNLKSNHELQAYFNKRLQKILEKYGKKMIGWDEILSNELPKSTMIHSWQGKEGMVTAAKNGYYSILSNGYYIDLCQSMVDHYYNDPLPENINLTNEEKKYILGGEATMWAELVNEDNVDTRIWPRTAAIAEVLWSGRKAFGQDSLYNNEMMFMRFNNFANNTLIATGVKISESKLNMFMNLKFKDDSFKIFALPEFCEPVKYYNRHRYTKYSQSTPLNRVVDIATPDAPASVYMNNLIGKKLRGENVPIPKNDDSFLTLEEKTLLNYQSDPTAKELIPLFRSLNRSMKILEELLLIEKGASISDAKYNEFKTELTELKKPVAELEIPYIDNLLKLLEYLKANSK
ncbi:MAG: family 20 glycosylhydrolase [Ignavibacteriae bacterium]|nr:family 20 glycosylhydrolase [Ignavibacteriota bacterium]